MSDLPATASPATAAPRTAAPAAKPRRQPPVGPSAARTLVLRAHPHADSFNSALAEAWAEGARSAGAEVDIVDLHELDFDPILHVAFRGDQPLEPDLERVRDQIGRAAHLVIAYPTWWGSTPAQLKGFIDRVFLPGWAFVDEGGALPKPGLAGRSARLLVTMDAPNWYDRWIYGAAGRRQIARATLRYCGIKPVGQDVFGNIQKSSPAQRERMLQRASRAGATDARRLVARFGPAASTGAAATAAG